MGRPKNEKLEVGRNSFGRLSGEEFYMENIPGEYVLTEVREVRIEQTGRNFYADETQL